MAEHTEDIEPETLVGCSGNVVPLHPASFTANPKVSEIISFNRRELNQILHVYGIKVAEGEWRDYAIDMLADRAVFSVYRRSAELPLFRIEKNPRLARRQGAFAVVATSGQILKRGHELASVLRFFERKPRLHSI